MFRNLPPVTKNLIIINLIIWLAMFLVPSVGNTLTKWCGLHFWLASDFNVAQLVTYMFMHDDHGFTHVLFNMFTLFMFGVLLERVMGSKRFLLFYLSCGVGAALIQELVWQFSYVDILSGWMMRSLDMPKATAVTFINGIMAGDPSGSLVGPVVKSMLNSLVTVGASGSIYGVLLAFAMIFPNMPMYLFFIPVPVKAKYMVLGYGVIELVIGLSGANDGVAHFAHLGGMLFAFLIIWWWKKKGLIHGGYGY